MCFRRKLLAALVILIVVSGGVHALSHAHASSDSEGPGDCAMCRLVHDASRPTPVPSVVPEVSESGTVAELMQPIEPSDDGAPRPHVPRAPPRQHPR
jgi:hypothetical protein